MPSGARKRKANKKKKASKNSTSTSTSRGDINPSQYESDVGETSDFLVTEGEEEELGKKKTENSEVEVEKSIDDVKNDEKKEVIEASIVEIETGLKRGSSKSSTSSTSSDDEPRTLVENDPVVDSVKVVESLSEEPNQVTFTTEKVVESSSAEAVNVEGKRVNGEVLKDLVPEIKSDEVIKAATTSDVKNFIGNEGEEKLIISYNAPRDDECVKEYSDRQPLIASPVQPVKTSSWKSCCGLFEAFTGSSA